MLQIKRYGLAGAALAMAVLACPALSAEPMALSDYMALKGPDPTEHVAYGPAPLQYVEFFKPAGAGPFAVAVLIHGGCFYNKYQGIPQMRGMAGALAARGVAVWSVEYRGLDTPGGGYPGTFMDVRSAMDLLAAQSKARHLNTDRMVVVGHSAGAALALWAAGRAELPASSPLHEPNPLPIRKVVSLGGFGDLRSMVGSSMATCGFEVNQIIGPPTAQRPDAYADTNPFDLSPNDADIVFVNGDHDTIVTPQETADYARRVHERGAVVETIVLPNASHYDEVAVTSPSWPVVEGAILKTLGIQ